MRSVRVTQFVGLGLALVMLTMAACSDDDRPGAGGSSGSTSGGTSGTSGSSGGLVDGGGDGGGSARDGGDAGGQSDGGGGVDGGNNPAACLGIPKEGVAVTQTRVDQADPFPTGGTILPGKYLLTGWKLYTGVGGATGATNERQRVTMLVENGNRLRLNMTIEIGTPDEEDLPPFAETYVNDPNGLTLLMTRICPMTSTRDRNFSVMGNDLWLHRLNDVEIYTKQ